MPTSSQSSTPERSPEADTSTCSGPRSPWVTHGANRHAASSSSTASIAVDAASSSCACRCPAARSRRRDPLGPHPLADRVRGSPTACRGTPAAPCAGRTGSARAARATGPRRRPCRTGRRPARGTPCTRALARRARASARPPRPRAESSGSTSIWRSSRSRAYGVRGSCTIHSRSTRYVSHVHPPTIGSNSSSASCGNRRGHEVAVRRDRAVLRSAHDLTPAAPAARSRDRRARRRPR